jgi:tyrosinase
MLSQIFDWAGFATHAEGELPGRGNSLEAVHDGIHFKIGGMSVDLKGHMGDNDVAGKLLYAIVVMDKFISHFSLLVAFDPIFFLHHANVDRLLSIWAALNPSVWVTPGNSGEGTVTIPADSIIDTKTGTHVLFAFSYV